MSDVRTGGRLAGILRCYEKKEKNLSKQEKKQGGLEIVRFSRVQGCLAP